MRLDRVIMSLAVVLSCEDGMVLASDGMDTIGGNMKVGGKKIYEFDDYLFANSGDISFLQKIRAILGKHLAEGKLDSDRRDMIKNDIVKELAKGNSLLLEGLGKKSVDELDDDQKIRFDFFIAYRTDDGKNSIWAYSDTLDDADIESKAYAIGSGSDAAYPLLKKYENVSMNIEEGKLLAYKVVMESIDAMFANIAEPVFIYTITEDGAKQIDYEEMKRIDDAYRKLHKLEIQSLKEVVGMMRELSGHEDMRVVIETDPAFRKSKNL